MKQIGEQYKPTEREIYFRMAILNQTREQALEYFKKITYAGTYKEIGGLVRGEN